MALGHHKIVRHCYRIAQLHIDARVNNNFDYESWVGDISPWVCDRLWRGYTFNRALHDIEVEIQNPSALLSVQFAARARDPTLIHDRYEAAVRIGFKNLLFNFGKTKFSIPKL